MFSLKITITQNADEDEIAIHKYISEEFGEIYAKDFQYKLIDLFRIISTNPFIGWPAKNDQSLRVYIFSKQNKIVYKNTNEEIIIIRILNTKTALSKDF